MHQGIFGFNADGSPAMAPAMAPVSKGAHDETVRAALLRDRARGKVMASYVAGHTICKRHEEYVQ